MDALKTPMTVLGTVVVMPGGGFDVRGCPDAIALASFIGEACNAYSGLVSGLAEANTNIDTLRGLVNDQIAQLDALKLQRMQLTKALQNIRECSNDGASVRQIVAAVLADEVAL